MNNSNAHQPMDNIFYRQDAKRQPINMKRSKKCDDLVGLAKEAKPSISMPCLKEQITSISSKGQSDPLWTKKRELGASWLCCMKMVDRKV